MEGLLRSRINTNAVEAEALHKGGAGACYLCVRCQSDVVAKEYISAS